MDELKIQESYMKKFNIDSKMMKKGK